MAWGDEQVFVGDETFVYYVGYARGHKVARYNERQIGLARMPRDRSVAREADLNPGRLVTKPLLMQAASMTVNAKIAGTLRVRLLDSTGKAIRDFDWVEVRGDSVAHRVPWKSSLKNLGKEPVRIECELRDARLFAFDLLD